MHPLMIPDVVHERSSDRPQRRRKLSERLRWIQAAPEDIYAWAVVGMGLLLWWLAFGLALVRLT